MGTSVVRGSDGEQGLTDALASLSVSVGVVGMRHLLVLLVVVEQGFGMADDGLGIGPHQPHSACGDGFGTFGGVSHHKHGLAKRWGFLLHPSRVGQDQVALVHEVHKGLVVQRCNQVHSGVIRQDAVYRFLHLGVQVHRVNDLHVSPVGQRAQGLADVFKALPKVFAAVSGDEDGLFLGVYELEEGLHLQAFSLVFAHLPRHVEQGINDGIARHMNGMLRHPFAEQVIARSWRWCEMQVCDVAGDPPVHLFRPG